MMPVCVNNSTEGKAQPRTVTELQRETRWKAAALTLPNTIAVVEVCFHESAKILKMDHGRSG